MTSVEKVFVYVLCGPLFSLSFMLRPLFCTLHLRNRRNLPSVCFVVKRCLDRDVPRTYSAAILQ